MLFKPLCPTLHYEDLHNQGERGHTRADFKLSDLPRTSGRIDVLCRFLNSAFLLSRGFRKNVRVWLFHYKAPKTDEDLREPEKEVEVYPDLYVSNRTDVLRLILKTSRVLLSSPRGWFSSHPNVSFVMGDP